MKKLTLVFILIFGTLSVFPQGDFRIKNDTLSSDFTLKIDSQTDTSQDLILKISKVEKRKQIVLPTMKFSIGGGGGLAQVKETYKPRKGNVLMLIFANITNRRAEMNLEKEESILTTSDGKTFPVIYFEEEKPELGHGKVIMGSTLPIRQNETAVINFIFDVPISELSKLSISLNGQNLGKLTKHQIYNNFLGKPSPSDNASDLPTKSIQAILRKNGLDPGPVDGRWGQKTANAVKEFQRTKNLPITGKIDDATKSALIKSL